MRLEKDKNRKACDRFHYPAGNWQWLWIFFFVVGMLGLGAQQAKASATSTYDDTNRINVTFAGVPINGLEIQCEPNDVATNFTVSTPNWSVNSTAFQEPSPGVLKNYVRLTRSSPIATETVRVRHKDANERGTRGRLHTTSNFVIISDDSGPAFLLKPRTDLPALIKLDFNNSTDNNEPNSEPGFTPFILADSGKEDVNGDAGVMVELSGNLSSARRVEPNETTGTPYRMLYRDFIFGIQPSGVTITLWGLGVGRDCNIILYAFDDTSEPSRRADWTATNGDNGEKYIFTADFNGNKEAYRPSKEYDYAWPGTATADKFGRIILESTRDPCSPANDPFAFVNALKVVTTGVYVEPTYAQCPRPVDGKEGAPVDTLLKWRKGAGAVNHELFFGTDEAAVTGASTGSYPGVMFYKHLDTNTYDPCGATGNLDLDTTYYWRVDENPGNYKGEVWSFKTLPYFVVEDFNSYDFGSNLLEYVWKDWSDNYTGAAIYLQMGVTDANFVRPKGDKSSNSMMYDYRPYYMYQGTPYYTYYSEAYADIADLGIDPDWLGMGAKLLTLWFYGKADNDANEKMYVTLTDGDGVSAKVIYDGDMNDLKVPTWQEWVIVLQDFADANNVNLSDISRITIGFGDGVEGPGEGFGIVYFEDIRPYATRCVLAKRSADFALVDFAPGGVPAGDCVIDEREIQALANTWLSTDSTHDTCNPGDANLVVYYPLDEGDGNKVYPDPCDPENPVWRGTFYNGQITPAGNVGASWATPGAPLIGGSGCVYFDGFKGSRISCGTYGQAGLGIGPTPPEVNAMTLSIWAKWLGPRTWDSYLFDKGQGFMGKRGGWSETTMLWTFWISGGSVGSFGLGNYPTDALRSQLVSPNNILDAFIGQWAHFAATFDGNTARLYLNGAQVQTGLWRFNHGEDPNIFLVIGNTQDINAWVDSPSNFYGYLDEARIYNRALDANEIAYLADTTPLDGKLASPVPSAAELYWVGEGPGQKKINFKDFTIIADTDKWLKEELWPR